MRSIVEQSARQLAQGRVAEDPNVQVAMSESTARHVDWRVGDPAGAELVEVRRVRDDIERRVTALAGELHGA